MPNWCENKLSVIGEHGRVMQFICKARGEYQYYAQSVFDKMQEEWRRKNQGDQFKTDEEKRKTELLDFSFHQLVPIPEAIMAQEYDPAGYEAEKNLWGIKWGGSSTRLVSYKDGVAHYRYNTPWAPGEKFLTKLSDKWPDLTFALSFREEHPTRGRFLFKGGKLVESVYDQPTDKITRSWENVYYRSHEKWVKEISK